MGVGKGGKGVGTSFLSLHSGGALTAFRGAGDTGRAFGEHASPARRSASSPAPGAAGLSGGGRPDRCEAEPRCGSGVH